MTNLNIEGPFTLYRLTEAFMSTVNDDELHLELFRQRSMVGFGEQYLSKAFAAIGNLIDGGHLKPAAEVDCHIEDLFRLTNTISRPWLLNEEVTVLTDDTFLSSSSVGDVFADKDGNLFVISDSEFLPFIAN